MATIKKSSNSHSQEMQPMVAQATVEQATVNSKNYDIEYSFIQDGSIIKRAFFRNPAYKADHIFYDTVMLDFDIYFTKQGLVNTVDSYLANGLHTVNLKKLMFQNLGMRRLLFLPNIAAMAITLPQLTMQYALFSAYSSPKWAIRYSLTQQDEDVLAVKTNFEKFINEKLARFFVPTDEKSSIQQGLEQQITEVIQSASDQYLIGKESLSLTTDQKQIIREMTTALVNKMSEQASTASNKAMPSVDKSRSIKTMLSKTFRELKQASKTPTETDRQLRSLTQQHGITGGLPFSDYIKYFFLSHGLLQIKNKYYNASKDASLLTPIYQSLVSSPEIYFLAQAMTAITKTVLFIPMLMAHVGLSAAAVATRIILKPVTFALEYAVYRGVYKTLLKPMMLSLPFVGRLTNLFKATNAILSSGAENIGKALKYLAKFLVIGISKSLLGLATVLKLPRRSFNFMQRKWSEATAVSQQNEETIEVLTDTSEKVVINEPIKKAPEKAVALKPQTPFAISTETLSKQRQMELAKLIVQCDYAEDTSTLIHLAVTQLLHRVIRLFNKWFNIPFFISDPLLINHSMKLIDKLSSLKANEAAVPLADRESYTSLIETIQTTLRNLPTYVKQTILHKQLREVNDSAKQVDNLVSSATQCDVTNVKWMTLAFTHQTFQRTCHNIQELIIKSELISSFTGYQFNDVLIKKMAAVKSVVRKIENKMQYIYPGNWRSFNVQANEQEYQQGVRHKKLSAKAIESTESQTIRQKIADVVDFTNFTAPGGPSLKG